MRNIFLALVLANLAFAAWHTWFSAEPRPASTVRTDVPGITLVSELEPDDADLREDVERARITQERTVETENDTNVAGDDNRGPDNRSVAGRGPDDGGTDGRGPVDRGSDSSDSVDLLAIEGGAEDLDSVAGDGENESSDVLEGEPNLARQSETPASRCVSVGPFRELSQAATAAANLRAAGYEPTQRVADGEIWVGYWVYIAAIPTQTQANEVLAHLRENGVTDSYVIPDTDNGNLVSLGVFSEISRAGRRREEVRALGYDPLVVDRTRRGTVYWVDVLLPPDQTLDFEMLQTPGRILRLEQRECESPPR